MKETAESSPVRMMRILIYTYTNAEAAIRDQERWSMPANGAKSGLSNGEYFTRSATLPPEILEGV